MNKKARINQARTSEIVGETASHISEKIKGFYPNIEWRLMKEMRNLLIHEYFGVDYTTLCNNFFRNSHQLLYPKKTDLIKI